MLFWVPCLALLLFLQPRTAIAKGAHEDYFPLLSTEKPI